MPPMNATTPPDDFYASLPLFRDFTEVMDPGLFTPLPADWVVGVADVVQSTKAIAENRYKAVNMAGAAVIVAVTNALGDRDFPFVFGGDGASFAVPARGRAAGAPGAGRDRDLGAGGPRSDLADRHGAGRGHSRAGPRRPRRALCAVGEHLDRDVLGRRHGLGRLRDEAWRDRARRRRRPARIPTCPGCRAATRKSRPRAGSCCRSWSRRGRRRRPRRSARRSRRSPASSRKPPTRRGRCRASGCASPGRRPGADLEARASRRAGESVVAAQDQGAGAGRCLRSSSCVSTSRSGSFIPAKYTRELIDNSDFRKFDDSLRMVLDCTPALADEIERHLDGLRRAGHRALRHAPPAARR